MTDIFISYSRGDVERAEAIAEALEAHGWGVWWDLRSLRTGQSFSKAIAAALGLVKCVIVLWSRASVDSRWVEAEASWAWEHKKLVSVLLDEALRPPFPYHNLHAEDLSRWAGDTKALAWRKLIADLTEFVGPPMSPAPAPATHIEVPIQPAEATASAAAVPRTTGFAFPETEMLRIEPGIFLMGSPEGEGFSDEHPQHEVRIGRAFAIGKYPVTFDQYDAFAKTTNRVLPDDEGWGRGNRPVINVCWDDAQAYASWRSARSGERYRLPTEAEWEYACRAGTLTSWWFGDQENDLDLYAWYSGNSDNKSHPVGEKQPNPWGLHDVHGNVREWVQDCWNATYKGWFRKAPADGSAWESGDRNGRVVRGGGWDDEHWILRSAARYWFEPDDAFSLLGFRLAMDL